jgi:hypothetical protein
MQEGSLLLDYGWIFVGPPLRGYSRKGRVLTLGACSNRLRFFFDFFFYENDSEYKLRWVLRKRGCSCSGARFRTLNKILENVGLAAKALDV